MESLKSEGIIYKDLEFIGEGLTSKVYKAIRKDSTYNSDYVVAIKILKSKKMVQILQQEFEKLKMLNNPSFVRLFTWEVFNGQPALILEYLEGGNLLDLMTKFVLAEDEIDYITAKVFTALYELKKKNYYHGDVSLKNIFVTSEGLVKLLDFGISNDSPPMGSPLFFSPERWLGQGPSIESDFFALGIINKILHQGFVPHLVETKNIKEFAFKNINQNSLLDQLPNIRTWSISRENNYEVQKKLALKASQLSSELNIQTEVIWSLSYYIRTIARGTTKVAVNILGVFVFSLTFPEQTGQHIYSLDIRSEVPWGIGVDERNWYYARHKMRIPKSLNKIKFSYLGKQINQIFKEKKREQIVLNDSFFEDNNK